jgi:hypothetical protein
MCTNPCLPYSFKHYVPFPVPGPFIFCQFLPPKTKNTLGLAIISWNKINKIIIIQESERGIFKLMKRRDGKVKDIWILIIERKMSEFGLI